MSNSSFAQSFRGPTTTGKQRISSLSQGPLCSAAASTPPFVDGQIRATAQPNGFVPIVSNPAKSKGSPQLRNWA